MNRELLERPFAPEQIRQRKGRNGVLDYVEGHSVIQRLNEALEGAWSFEIVQHEIREETAFVEVVVWGKQGEVVAAHMTKGRPVFVEGRLQQDTWEAESGERRSRLKVVAERVTFLPRSGTGAAPVGEGDAAEPAWVAEEA